MTLESRPAAPRWRRVAGWVLTSAAAVLVYLALIVPDAVARPPKGTATESAFLRLPIEVIIGAAVLLALPRRWRRPVAALLGLGLGVVVVLKIVNMGFRTVLGRRFNPVLDWPLFHDGFNALVETDGRGKAIGAVIGAVALSLIVLALCTLAVLRLTRLTARYPGPARRTLVGLTAVWVALAISGLTWFPSAPVASDTSADLLKSTVKQVPAALRDQRKFAAQAAADPYRKVPPQEMLTGLRGKDVVIGVVESYGRSSLTKPNMRAIVDPQLAVDAKKLEAAGFAAKSGWLTSSTFSGGSWLAHATLQSGLWIDNTQRYRQLTASNRVTITSAFHDAGWRTVGMEPGNTVAWPEASFYKYDEVWDSRNLGYQGPRFGWSRMPDQYTFKKFQDNVYAKKTGPLMAEITMTSSHEPWTPIPRMLDWDQVGDGSVYRSMTQGFEPRSTLWTSGERTQVQYAKSIAYSVDALISWAQKYGDKDLVVVMFGDHQPMPLVSGYTNASHDIPITIIAHDREVLDRLSGWNWADGLKPGADTPVWPMSEFRDKFFAAYGSRTATAMAQPH
ncbi:sulfatase-like hydrolase/transferase [Actinoplanes sp. CA-030573]|uniref:sulfatase-like hydrolase/transferase n=1 Tax=Actinoplanes sp. CA-030573 TaxID=3239898 RepID=UPI003D90F78E